MSITTALKARREQLDDREAGFTLIELLVVVIIIGILAAVAIPVYIGVQNSAKDSSAKSDLISNKTAIVNAATDANGVLPTSADSTSLAKYGWSASPGNTFTYTVGTGANAGLFCLLATSPTNNKFVVTTNTSVTGGTTTTACPTAY